MEPQTPMDHIIALVTNEQWPSLEQMGRETTAVRTRLLLDLSDYVEQELRDREKLLRGRIRRSEESGCGCWNCVDELTRITVFIVCENCGNKRCPHATDHRLECTDSNEPGQPGSRFAVPEGGATDG